MISIAKRKSRWWTKPPQMVRPNHGHKLLRNCRIFWAPHYCLSLNTTQADTGFDSLGNTITTNGIASTMISGPYGPAVKFNSTSEYYQTTLQTPSTSCTIATLMYIDPSPHDGIAFGVSTSSPNRFGAMIPFAGTCYWDFGDTSGAGRVSWTPASNFNGNWHKIVLRAGERGMSAWVDGQKMASSSTPTSISPVTQEFDWNSGAGHFDGGIAGFSLFICNAFEWSDTDIVKWTNDPWQVFVPPCVQWELPLTVAGPPPTTATLSGPSPASSFVGVASGNFTITLDNSATSSLSFPITYSGGTVTPSSVVISSGTTGTFTVTPTAVGTANVSLGAGSTGLTIAGSPISYTGLILGRPITMIMDL